MAHMTPQDSRPEELRLLEYDVVKDGDTYRATYQGEITALAEQDGCVRVLEDTDFAELRRRAVANRICAWMHQSLARCGETSASMRRIAGWVGPRQHNPEDARFTTGDVP